MNILKNMVNKKIADIIKEYILYFYEDVDIVDVKIQLYTQDIPTISVYFRQDEPNVRNLNQILCQNIKKNVKNHLGYTVVGGILLPWQTKLIENQDPVARIECHSINFEPF